MDKETEPVIPLEIMFFKLASGEDLVAYLVSQTEETFTVKRPLSVLIENEFETARQLIQIREWLPPIVVKFDEIELPKDILVCMMETRDSFKDEYIDVCNYFYAVKPKPKERIEKRLKEGNVIPFSFISKDDQGKIH